MAIPISPGPGVYVILFRLDEKLSLSAGRLGARSYARGWYAYVGSARRGIAGRLKHHLRPFHARPHWHIDYLLPRGSLDVIVAVETTLRLECSLAESIGRTAEVAPRFGASDCGCPGHLFHTRSRKALMRSITKAIEQAGERPLILSPSNLA